MDHRCRQPSGFSLGTLLVAASVAQLCGSCTDPLAGCETVSAGCAVQPANCCQPAAPDSGSGRHEANLCYLPPRSPRARGRAKGTPGLSEGLSWGAIFGLISLVAGILWWAFCARSMLRQIAHNVSRLAEASPDQLCDSKKLPPACPMISKKASLRGHKVKFVGQSGRHRQLRLGSKKHHHAKAGS